MASGRESGRHTQASSHPSRHRTRQARVKIDWRRAGSKGCRPPKTLGHVEVGQLAELARQPLWGLGLCGLWCRPLDAQSVGEGCGARLTACSTSVTAQPVMQSTAMLLVGGGRLATPEASG